MCETLGAWEQGSAPRAAAGTKPCMNHVCMRVRLSVHRPSHFLLLFSVDKQELCFAVNSRFPESCPWALRGAGRGIRGLVPRAEGLGWCCSAGDGPVVLPAQFWGDKQEKSCFWRQKAGCHTSPGLEGTSRDHWVQLKQEILRSERTRGALCGIFSLHGIWKQSSRKRSKKEVTQAM